MKRGGDLKRWSAVAVLVAGLLVSSAVASASFGHHGKRVISNLGVVWDALPYGRAKTLLVSGLGAESKITRLRSNGSIDRSFGTDGRVDVNSLETSVQAGGGILVLSSEQQELGGTSPVVTRLLPGGEADKTFGRGGSVQVDLGDRFDEAAAMTALPDGKIVIAGRSGPNFDPRTGIIFGDTVVARLSADGALDHSFGGDGRVVVPAAEEPAALRPGPDGTVYLQDGSSIRRLIRLKRNGRIDSSYGEQGTVTIPFQVEPPETFFLPQGDFAVLSGGGVMIAASLSTSGDGYKHDKAGVLRLRPDGSVSGAYGNGGLARVGIPGGWVSASGVAATADGRAVVLTSSQVPLGSRSRMTAFALTPAGKLDGRFGRGGRMTIGSGGWVTGDDLFLRRGKAFLVGSVRGPKTLLAQVPLVRHR
jgi:uncharacterized delta-60 repeat protein